VIDWKHQCVAVIPCFNEAVEISEVVAGIKRFLPNVIVIDDGSADATAELAKESGAKILSLKKNSGKGAALRAGWKFAGELGFNWILMLDGDGQHAAHDIPKFFDAAEKTNAVLVVGNRMGNSAAMPWLRRKVNQIMSKRISHLTGARLPDSQCGFRLAHLETLLSLPIAANRFEIESEMLVAFFAAGYKIEFVPIQTIYKNAASKIRPLPDTCRWLRWQFAQCKPYPRESLLAQTATAKTFSGD
jgi:UDP-N-acetylglucosamine---dolichyl-phosphate N-acetylglucosaminyltransferase